MSIWPRAFRSDRFDQDQREAFQLRVVMDFQEVMKEAEVNLTEGSPVRWGDWKGAHLTPFRFESSLSFTGGGNLTPRAKF